MLKSLSNTSTPIITLEEHNLIGGLGSAVSEIVTMSNPRKVIRIGANDCFTKKCGTYDYVMKEHGLDCESIKKKLIELDL